MPIHSSGAVKTVQPTLAMETPSPKRAELLTDLPQLRAPLALTLLWGLLQTLLTVGQMFLLSTIVAEVFLAHAVLAQVGQRLLLLLACGTGLAGLGWLREVTAQSAA